jgi:pantetheine-phosphate adenylyltransferase
LKKYKQVVLGGTFDILHLGHLELFRKSFEIGCFVVIGITSDEFACNRLNKRIKNSYPVRVQNLKKFIEKEIGFGNYKVTKLEDNFGPLMISSQIDCLVVSSETEERGNTINHTRLKLGLPAVDVIPVKMILAEDGFPISSSRIRSNDIDENGFIIKK